MSDIPKIRRRELMAMVGAAMAFPGTALGGVEYGEDRAEGNDDDAKEYGAGLSVLASVPEEEQAFLIALLRTQAERSLPSGRHFEIRVMAPHDYGRGRQIGWYSPARSNTIFDWNAKPFLCERFKDAKFEPYIGCYIAGRGVVP